MSGSLELGIAATAASTAGYDNFLVRMREVIYLLAGVGVVNDSSDRNLQHYSFAISSGLVGSSAVTTALRLVLGIETEVNQRVVTLARFHDDVAATSAITTRGAAARHELLAPEGKTPVAAVASLHANCGFIDKHDIKGRNSQYRRGCARLTPEDAKSQ